MNDFNNYSHILELEYLCFLPTPQSDSNQNIKFMMKMLEINGNIEVIYLSGLKLGDNDLMNISKYCPLLKSLTLNQYESIDIFFLLKILPNLEILHTYFSTKYVYRNTMDNLVHKHLNELSIHLSYYDCSDFFSKIYQILPNLCKLTFHGHFRNKFYSKLNDDINECLKNNYLSNHITTFKFSNCDSLNILQLFPNLKNLEMDFNISLVAKFNGNILHRSELFQNAFNQLTYLKTLSFQLIIIDLDLIEIIFQNCKFLVNISFKLITNEGLQYIIDNNSNTLNSITLTEFDYFKNPDLPLKLLYELIQKKSYMKLTLLTRLFSEVLGSDTNLFQSLVYLKYLEFVSQIELSFQSQTEFISHHKHICNNKFTNNYSTTDSYLLIKNYKNITIRFRYIRI